MEFPEYVDEDEMNDPTFLSNMSLSNVFRRRQILFGNFSKRWCSEYLMSLRERRNISGGNGPFAKVGDVVLIGDDNSRLHWKMGIVEKLIVGNDGKIRSAMLKTKLGKTVRSLSMLYPLEISFDIRVQDVIAEIDTQRPRRQAALRAEENIARLLRD